MTMVARRDLVAGLCLTLGCAVAWPASAEVVPIAIGFHVPVVRDVPRRDVETSLRFWTEEIGAALNLKYKPVRMYDSMDDLRRGMQSGDINFVVGSAMTVAQHFSDAELIDGFSGSKTTPDHLLLAVRRDANIAGPAQLLGKRVVLLEQDELSDVYLQTLLAPVAGPKSMDALVDLRREKRSANLIHRLFFNQADAALITRNAYDTALELNPQVGKQLKVLEAYSFKGRSVTVGLFSAKVPLEDAQAITQGAMNLQKTARGRQILEVFQADAITPSKVSDLSPFRALLLRQQALNLPAHVPGKKAR